MISVTFGLPHYGFLSTQVGRVRVIFGHGDVIPLDACPHIVIVSYHMLRILKTHLLSFPWEMVIFDESHSITTAAAHTEGC